MTALALGSVVPGHAWASTLYLTVTEGDDSLSDGVCDAECTFRDAVSVACDSEDDAVQIEVEVDSELSEVGIDDDNTAGDLDFCSKTTGKTITVNGNDYKLAWKSAVAKVDRDRLIHVVWNPGAGLYTVDVVLRDLEISGGYVFNQSVGGGCVAAQRGALTLEGVEVHGCEASTSVWSLAARGGGAVWAGDTLVIDSSELYENVATNTTGGAILASGDLFVTDTQILDNEATYGGGVAVPGSVSEAFFTRSWIGGNTAEDRGGGLWSRAVRLNLFRTEVFDNVATFGGGMYIDLPLDPNLDPILERSALVGNEATAEGGGLWVRSEYAGARDIVNSTISSNIAPDGAGLYLANGGVEYTVKLVSTTVHLNNDGDSSPTYNVAHVESDPVLRYVGSLIDGNCTGKATVTDDWNVVLLVSSDQCTVDVKDRDTWFSFGLGGLSTLTLGEPRFHDNDNFGTSLNWIDDADCPTSEDQRGNTRPNLTNQCDSGATEN
jgi:hypothetical protein